MNLFDSPDPEPPANAPKRPASLMVPADPAAVASALAYGLRFDERGHPRRGSVWETAAALLPSSSPPSWSGRISW